jgi:hypothetical protein
MKPLSTVRALIAATLLAVPAVARGQGAPPVIGPGQEPLLADMLGKGTALPGDCAWAGATVEQTRVVSWYTCAGARVEIELRHPTDAVAAAARTDRFAIRTRAASPPPGLVDALAARIRAREAAFVWRGGADDLGGGARAPLSEQHRQALRGLGVALAVAAITAALMRWIYRRLARAASPAAPLPSRAGLAAAALVIVVSTGLAAAVHRAARAFGDASIAGLDRRPGVPVAASAGIMLVYVVLALGASALLARIPTKLPSFARFAAGAAIYLGIAYPRSLAREAPPAFGDVVALRPDTTTVEARRDRPPVTYRTHDLGFREPGWSIQKPEGTRRIALLGDSYVFGIGVEVGDTLSAALGAELAKRSPGQRVEILNLGIPGDNLASHIDVYEAAEKLDLDAVVVCLTLPNDLSRWDAQVARRASAHVGAFSFARFVFGNAAETFWDLALLERSITPPGLAHLDHQMTRLTALRAASTHHPELVFFSFRELAAVIGARLGAVPGARVVPEGETFPEDFLPGDGHPTGEGNRRSARRIADAL